MVLAHAKLADHNIAGFEVSFIFKLCATGSSLKLILEVLQIPNPKYEKEQWP